VSVAPIDRAALDDRLAHTPAPEDRDGGTGFDLCGVEHGADAGGHAAAHERELLGRQVGGDADEERLLHGHLLGEGREA
jgi:hypothetical protein